MDQWQALDETLQRLNGLRDDKEKRDRIIQDVQEKKTMAVFAFGSLIWNPITPVENTIRDCTLREYTKGFFCQDFVYRGTPECMGLTMALKPRKNSFVKGEMLITGINQMIQFLEAFIERESPIDTKGREMDIYTFDYLPVTVGGETSTRLALTCVANHQSQFYVSIELSIEDQAKIIGRSVGSNGSNWQYLQKVTEEYERLNLQDTQTEEMKQLCAAVSLIRQCLVEEDRQWLEMFDRLPKNERQRAIESRQANNIEGQPAA